MDQSLSKLLALVPPPKRPKEVGAPARWARAEAKLGVQLPDDYRQFVHAYGSGLFAGFYVIHTPCAKNPYANLVEYVRLIGPHIESHERLPFAVHPARPGLLVWGHDENGNYYYWLTKGDPDRWTVVTESVRGTGFAKHRCSMVEYLLRVQQIKIRPLASGYPRLVMRCPSEECLGWAEGAHGADDPWSCETCGSEWEDRESFEEEVATVIHKHPHRRPCYVRKRGHYYPAPREQEHPNYARLVRREFDDQ
jgi:hypothetical protein